MAIPDFQTLMLPVLQAAVGMEVNIGELVEKLADEFKLTEEERRQLLPSGRQTTFANRTHWAKTYLGKAGLIELTRRGYFKITSRGKEVLAKKPKRIDMKFLSQYDEFKVFRSRDRGEEPSVDTVTAVVESATQTPDELIRGIHREIEQALKKELLDRILNAASSFFEKVVVELLLTMGYGGGREGAGRAIGGAGDGGLDGVIDQDALGLDRVYIQAKRYKLNNAVSENDIRAFAGSLEGAKATKGIFVTTSYFTEPARKFAEKVVKRIILIDGEQLASLLLRYDVGVRVETAFSIKKIDEDFFVEN
jgi:restriction system protein